jgi:CheY-like chemotaxis protein
MLEPILVVEDIAPTRIQLASLIAEALDNVVRVETAETVQDAIDNVDRMADEGRSYSVAVVDVMVPDKPGSAPIPAERMVQCLATRMPETLLIIVTAYTEDLPSSWQATYTSAPGSPDSYFVPKKDVRWGDRVVAHIKAHVWGEPIRAALDALFGPLSPSGSPPTKHAAGGRFAGRSYRLEDLTLQIRQHFPDLDPDLQKRIRSHFEVDDSNRRDIKAGLKLAL